MIAEATTVVVNHTQGCEQSDCLGLQCTFLIQQSGIAIPKNPIRRSPDHTSREKHSSPQQAVALKMGLFFEDNQNESNSMELMIAEAITVVVNHTSREKHSVTDM